MAGEEKRWKAPLPKIPQRIDVTLPSSFACFFIPRLQRLPEAPLQDTRVHLSEEGAAEVLTITPYLTCDGLL